MFDTVLALFVGRKPGLASLWVRHGDPAEAFPPGGVRRLWLYRPVRDRGGGAGAGVPGADYPSALGRGGPFPGEAAASAGEGCHEAGKTDTVI